MVLDPTGRPTEHSGPKEEPPAWSHPFWRRHLEGTGQTCEEAIAMLTSSWGEDGSGSLSRWRKKPGSERNLHHNGEGGESTASVRRCSLDGGPAYPRLPLYHP
jgi:hypothetical protein